MPTESILLPVSVEAFAHLAEFIQTNQVALAREGVGLRNVKPESMESPELIARSNILSTLTRMGMTQTNLARLTE